MAQRLTREEKKERTRAQLLEAAATLVARHGAEATSLDRIAEKAGVTKGAVYSNFRSKEDLLFALAEAHAGPSIGFEEHFDESPIADQFERMGRLVASELRRTPQRAWRLGLELHYYAIRNARARRTVAHNRREGFEEGGVFLERLVAERGESLPLSGAEMLVVLNALALGLGQERAIDPQSVPDELFAKAFRLLAG